MARGRRKGIMIEVPPFLIDEFRKYFAALERAADEAETTREMMQAASEAAEEKGYLVDAMKTVLKLKRKKQPVDAQAWLEAVQLYAAAIGLLDQKDLFRKFDAPAASPLN